MSKKNQNHKIILSWKEKDSTPLENLIVSTDESWFKAKHPVRTKEEISFIASLRPDGCPYCGSKNYIKYGKRNGIPIFRCKSCERRFKALTHTIFDSAKIPISEWYEFFIHLCEFHSISTASADNRNASNTGLMWYRKIFLVLEGIQDDVVLKGRIWLDETFFSVIRKDEVLKDGKKLRGISRNKICTAVAVDDSGTMLIRVEWVSKPSNRSTLAALENHIQEGSTLIHDGEKSHNTLIMKRNLKSEVYDTDMTRKLSDKDNPLNRVNHLHSLIKQFMGEHGGYDRSQLQGWMNLLWFILSRPFTPAEKFEAFVKRAISVHKTLRVDMFLSKKHDS